MDIYERRPMPTDFDWGSGIDVLPSTMYANAFLLIHAGTIPSPE